MADGSTEVRHWPVSCWNATGFQVESYLVLRVFQLSSLAPRMMWELSMQQMLGNMVN